MRYLFILLIASASFLSLAFAPYPQGVPSSIVCQAAITAGFTGKAPKNQASLPAQQEALEENLAQLNEEIENIDSEIENVVENLSSVFKDTICETELTHLNNESMCKSNHFTWKSGASSCAFTAQNLAKEIQQHIEKKSGKLICESSSHNSVQPLFWKRGRASYFALYTRLPFLWLTSFKAQATGATRSSGAVCNPSDYQMQPVADCIQYKTLPPDNDRCACVDCTSPKIPILYSNNQVRSKSICCDPTDPKDPYCGHRVTTQDNSQENTCVRAGTQLISGKAPDCQPTSTEATPVVTTETSVASGGSKDNATQPAQTGMNNQTATASQTSTSVAGSDSAVSAKPAQVSDQRSENAGPAGTRLTQPRAVASISAVGDSACNCKNKYYKYFKNKGRINKNICKDKQLTKELTDEEVEECKGFLEELTDTIEVKKDLEKELKQLKNEKKKLNREARKLKLFCLKRKNRDHLKCRQLSGEDIDQSQTEGRAFCVECFNAVLEANTPKKSFLDSVKEIATPLVALGVGYHGIKRMGELQAAAGYSSNSAQAMAGLALPFIAKGLYGSSNDLGPCSSYTGGYFGAGGYSGGNPFGFGPGWGFSGGGGYGGGNPFGFGPGWGFSGGGGYGGINNQWQTQLEIRNHLQNTYMEYMQMKQDQYMQKQQAYMQYMQELRDLNSKWGGQLSSGVGGQFQLGLNFGLGTGFGAGTTTGGTTSGGGLTPPAL